MHDSCDVDHEIAEHLVALLAATPENIAPSSFDHLVRLAADLMQCDTAVLVLGGVADFEDGDVALVPLDPSIESPIVMFALEGDEAIVLSDLVGDERFSADPLVTSFRRIRYFASAPLINSHGHRLGTLCVTDSAPRKSQRSNEIDAIKAVAEAIVATMELDESRLKIRIQRLELNRLGELQVMKDEFFAMVSHELRTPLTSITASLGLLEDGIVATLSDDALEILRVARTNSDRMISLVDDLLDFERMGSGVFELHRESSFISEILDQSIDCVQGIADRSGVLLKREDRYDIESRVLCDVNRIVQVLVNLFGNAIKFAGEDSTVTIRTEVVDDELLTFSVIDRGNGIAASSIARLFDPFWQDDSYAARRLGGSGLGLAISKRIVDHHHGRIEVNSTIGVGSTFRVVLPLNADERSRITSPM